MINGPVIGTANEVFQFNRLVYSTWYDVLNLDFRVTAIASTDYPCAAAAIRALTRSNVR